MGYKTFPKNPEFSVAKIGDISGGASLNIQLRRFNAITIVQPSLSYDIITKVDYD